jgi:hypothetical protein
MTHADPHLLTVSRYLTGLDRRTPSSHHQGEPGLAICARAQMRPPEAPPADGPFAADPAEGPSPRHEAFTDLARVAGPEYAAEWPALASALAGNPDPVDLALEAENFLGAYGGEVGAEAGGLLAGLAANAFCPTGAGGGVDPSCSPKAERAAGRVARKREEKAAARQESGAARHLNNLLRERTYDITQAHARLPEDVPTPALDRAVAALSPSVHGRTLHEKLAAFERVRDEAEREGRLTEALQRLVPRHQESEMLGHLETIRRHAEAAAAAVRLERAARKATRDLAANAFCPTGEGGGVDPSCSPGGAGGAGQGGVTDAQVAADARAYVASKPYLDPDAPGLSPYERRHRAADRRAVETHRQVQGVVSTRPRGAEWEDDHRNAVEEQALALAREKGRGDADLGFATRSRARVTDVNVRAEPAAGLYRERDGSVTVFSGHHDRGEVSASVRPEDPHGLREYLLRAVLGLKAPKALRAEWGPRVKGRGKLAVTRNARHGR